MTSSTLEGRVQLLEMQLGVVADSDAQEDASALDRLEALERRFDTMPASLRESLTVIHRLLEELSPGTALTHQQQIVAPLLYRRQHVLACQESLRQQMQQVAQILQLLLIDSTQTTVSSNKSMTRLTEEQVTQAPILNVADMPEDQVHRCQALQETLNDLQRRMDATTLRLDQMLDQYHAYMAALSEQLVLAQEIKQSEATTK